MSDKTIKTLAIVFVGLVVIFGLSKLLTVKQQQAVVKSYDFAALKAEAIDKVDVKKEKDSFTLTKKGKDWQVNDLPAGRQGKKAAKSNIDELFNTLKTAKVKEIASQETKNYSLYQVDDKTGKKVTFFSGGGKKAEFIVGKQSDYQSFYIKFADDKNVYVVKGTLATLFEKKPGDWKEKPRNK